MENYGEKFSEALRIERIEAEASAQYSSPNQSSAGGRAQPMMTPARSLAQPMMTPARSLARPGDEESAPGTMVPPTPVPAAKVAAESDVLKDSGKVQFTLKLLRRLEREGHRVLVFSQSKKVLNIIQVRSQRDCT